MAGSPIGLRCALKQYYPQVLEWFERIDTPLFCAFVKRWPTLIQAKPARANTLKRFFHEHHMYREGVLDHRRQAINSAKPLTLDEAVIVPYRMQVLVLVEQLELMFKAIDQFDDEIAKLAYQHPDYALFEPLPGAGPSLTPRLMVAFGEQRERFSSAADVQKLSGVAPVTERSGQKHWVHWRLQCPTFMRQTFVGGRGKPSTNHTGQEPTIDNNERRELLIRLQSGRWRSNGYGFFTVAGSPVSHTMSQDILKAWSDVGHP